MLLKYRSARYRVAAGAMQSIDRGFLPRLGPRNGRLLIHYLRVESLVDFSTAAGVTATAVDQSSYLQGIRLKTRAGEMFRGGLTGMDILQNICIPNFGVQHPAYPAALIANTANQIHTFVHHIPLSRIHAHRGKDFGLYADTFLDDATVLELTAPTLAQVVLGAAAGASTINTIDYTVELVCEERFGDGVEFLPSMSYEKIPLPTLTSIFLPTGNRPLAWANLFLQATTGGTAMANMTDATIEALGLISIPNASLVDHYRTLFGSTMDLLRDPTVAGLMVPLIAQHRDCKVGDMPRVRDSLRIRLTNTVANLSVIAGFVEAKDRATVENAVKIYGVGQGATSTVKTANKTRRDAASWKSAAAFMPEKAHKVRAQARTTVGTGRR
jgi:hypothetical protein